MAVDPNLVVQAQAEEEQRPQSSWPDVVDGGLNAGDAFIRSGSRAPVTTPDTDAVTAAADVAQIAEVGTSAVEAGSSALEVASAAGEASEGILSGIVGVLGIFDGL